MCPASRELHAELALWLVVVFCSHKMITVITLTSSKKHEQNKTWEKAKGSLSKSQSKPDLHIDCLVAERHIMSPR